MSKTSAAQRERKRVRRSERKAEQAALIDKGKAADFEQVALEDRIRHFTELANRASDIEYQRDQTRRECIALQKDVERAREVTGQLKAQLQQAQKRIEDDAALIAYQKKELTKLRSDDHDTSKLRRRLHGRTEELKEARAKYNQIVREVRSGKFKDQKTVEEKEFVDLRSEVTEQ